MSAEFIHSASGRWNLTMPSSHATSTGWLIRGIVLAIAVMVASCDDEPPASTPAPVRAYTPQTFRADVTRLIAAREYQAAVEFLAAADVARQVAYDKTGYLAVAEDMIVLPGVYPQVEHDRGRDWEFPGTSDAVHNGPWQNAATDFARRYNLLRQADSHP